MGIIGGATITQDRLFEQHLSIAAMSRALSCITVTYYLLSALKVSLMRNQGCVDCARLRQHEIKFEGTCGSHCFSVSRCFLASNGNNSDRDHDDEDDDGDDGGTGSTLVNLNETLIRIRQGKRHETYPSPPPPSLCRNL